MPVREVSWLTARLHELGFDAFEERSLAGGRCLVIYDHSAAVLERVQRELAFCAREREPELRLQFELSEPDPSWSSKWTEHLVPVQLTATLSLIPSAAPAELEPGNLYLAPAFAFGFGEHASTRLIASWLEGYCRASPGASVLDVGSGTGVLSLVAKRNGAGRVLGLDTSEAALEAARSNALSNRISGVEFASVPLAEIAERFDCVVANIEAPVLSALGAALCEKLNPAGALALTGFIAEQVAPLQRCFGELGLALECAEREGDWCLLVKGKRQPQSS